MKKQLILLTILTFLLCGCSTQTVTETAEESLSTMQAVPTVYTEPKETDNTISTVTVSTVDELLSQLESNRTILLKGGTYDLSTAAKYGRSGSAAYHWEESYEGFELVLCDAVNLTIQAEAGEEVSIVTTCPAVNVMNLRFCDNVTLSGLTLGHDAEAGSCTGGVVNLDRSQNIELDGCKLYGCGTRGINAWGCENIHAVNTEIYECSDGGISVNQCYNFLFENGSIHDCNFYMLVDVFNSREAAIINSELRNNHGEYGTMFQSNCPGFYLGGLLVEDNDCYEFFNQSIFPAAVEGCRFRSNGRLWSSGLDPVDKDGTKLTLVTLMDMDRDTVAWAPASKPEPIVVPPVSEDGWIHVTNADELLAAIAPNTSIFLEPGEYSLAQARDYGFGESKYYFWQPVDGGAQLLIHDVTALTLCGTKEAKIVAEAGSGSVVSFSGCSNFSIKELSFGHTKEQYDGTGCVLEFWNCEDIKLGPCDLDCRGTVGITAYYSHQMEAADLNLLGACIQAVQLDNCSDMQFNNCTVQDTGWDTWYVVECEKITRDGKLMESAHY